MGISFLLNLTKKNYFKTLLSTVYICLSGFFIVVLAGSNKEYNPNILMLLYILTWINNTFAYLTGISLGKNQIFKSISPKKSWEGFAGGFVFTMIAAYLSQKFFIHIALRDVLFVSIILPFTATLGDLIESHYKREAGVKDSGDFIPGHGGMLDRMDAFTITIPAIYIIVNLL